MLAKSRASYPDARLRILIMDSESESSTRGPAGKRVEFSHSEHNSLSYIDLIDKQLKCHGFDLLSQVQLKTSQPAQMLGMVR